jgi:hypothetical protein
LGFENQQDLKKIGVFFEFFFVGMLVLGVKIGVGRLICRVWVRWARKKRSKTFENSIETFEN